MNSVSQIDERELRFYRRYHQNQIFNEIVGYFASLAEKGELTKSDIAKKLRKHPSQITNWFTEPGNFSIDTISDLLVAMGAAMDITVRKARISQRSVDAIVESFDRWRSDGQELKTLVQDGRRPPIATGGNNTVTAVGDQNASTAA